MMQGASELCRNSFRKWFLLPEYTRSLLYYFASSLGISILFCGLFFFLRKSLFRVYLMDELFIKYLSYKDAIDLIQVSLIFFGVFFLSLIFMVIAPGKHDADYEFTHFKEAEKAFDEIKHTSGQLVETYKEMLNANAQCELIKEELFEQKKFLLDMIDVFPAMVIYKDSSCVYQIVNKATADLLCLLPAEIVGKTAKDLAWPDKERQISDERDREVLQGKSKINIEQATGITGNTNLFMKFRYPFKKGTLTYAVNLDKQEEIKQFLHASEQAKT